MLNAAHRQTVSYLLSEVASPRALTTRESAWISRVLGGLAEEAQSACELRMSETGPLVVRRVAGSTVEAAPNGSGTVAILHRDGRGPITHRFADDLDAAAFLLGLDAATAPAA